MIAHTYHYSFYHSSDAFRAEHQQRLGHKPYIIPFAQARWSSGATVSARQHAEGLGWLDVYRAWLLATFRNRKNLVVLPVSSVAPHYCDEPAGSPSWQTATDEPFLPPVLGSLDVVVPVGEVPYESGVSGVQEYLPVALDMLGAPGMDYWVLDSMRMVLRKSGRPAEVRTGRRMYS